MSAGQSGTFRIDYDTRARRQLDRINARDYGQILKRIKALATDPRPPRSLRLRDGAHRIRSGNWRIFYEVDVGAGVVIVTDVRRRNERTYRDR